MRAALIALAVIGLAACGGGSEAAPVEDTRTKSQKFFDLIDERGLTTDTKPDEMESVAANLCDNTVADMKTFFGMMAFIPGADLEAVRDERLVMTEVFCPDKDVTVKTAYDDYQQS